MRSARTVLSSLALLLFVPTAGAQSLWTVNDDGGGDFTQIQDAVDAAAPGDVIRVLSGAYEPVLVAGKGVTITGDGSAAIFVATPPALVPFRVQDVPAGEELVLSGFTIFNGNAGPAAALEVEGCAGTVWLQDLFVDSYGATAFRASNSSAVVVTNSLLQMNLAPAEPDGTPRSMPGALIENRSSVFFYQTATIGSHGTLIMQGLPDPNAPAPGGAGVILLDSTLTAHGSDLSGGSGGTFFDGTCVSGADGGAGLLLGLGQGIQEPEALLFDTDLTGGGPGFFDQGCGDPPVGGPPSHVDAGSLTSSALPVRELGLVDIAPAGTSVDMVLIGEPGDIGVVYASDRAGAPLALALLTLHLDPSSLTFVGLVALPDGDETLSVTAPDLGTGDAVFDFALQAFFRSATGTLHASGPRSLLLH